MSLDNIRHNIPQNKKILALAMVVAVVGAGQQALASETFSQLPSQLPSQEYELSQRHETYEDYYQDEEVEEDERTTTGLAQQSNLIGACRYSPNSLDVFADADRTQRLATIVPYTPLTLTGVVGTGIAEIRYPASGWIDTLTVEPCSDETPTPPPEPEPDGTACYRVLTNVNVRTAPNVGAPALGYIGTGGIAYATTNPPTDFVSSDGRIWIEIADFFGETGWIAITGPSGAGSNAIRLEDEQCDR